MKNSSIKSNTFKVFRGIAVTLICIGLWELFAVITDNPYFLPHVGETFSALITLIKSSEFFLNILISLSRVAAGLLIGIIIGLLLAMASHYFKISNSIISPLISIMKATPIATIILILWFTFTDASLSIFVVFLMVTPIVWQNVLDGLKSIPEEMSEVCEIFELSIPKKIKLLIIPTVSRYLIPAIITSIGFAWKAEIAAEIMTYSNIGRSIQDYKTLHYDTAAVFAWAFVIIVLSLVLESVTKYFLRRIKI